MIVQVIWKDEGDFGFITTRTQRDLDHVGSVPGAVPFDPNRVKAHGSIAEAQALADEHGAELVIT